MALIVVWPVVVIATVWARNMTSVHPLVIEMFRTGCCHQHRQ
jgi:hypothetical protein